MPSTLMVTLLYMIIELVRQVAVLAFPWLVVISPQSIRNLQECTSQVVAANSPTTEQSQYYPFFSSILEKAVYNRRHFISRSVWISEKSFHLICFTTSL